MPSARINVYSPSPYGDYASAFPNGHEIRSLTRSSLEFQAAAWNAYWLLRPDVDDVLNGVVSWHQYESAPFLIPDIIGDMVEHASRFVDHPIKLGDYLINAKPRLKCWKNRYNMPMPDLWARVMSVSNQRLIERPFVVRVGERLIVRQHDAL